MSKIPSITLEDIRSRVGPASYKRSHGYVGNGSIYNTRRIGSTLKARCQGNLPDPYYVEASFNATGIEAADCSCPVGDGGYCKHVAALLRTWLNEPESFIETEDLETSLENRTKEELILIIRTMLARYPDLESVVTQPVATDADSGLKIDTSFLEDQIKGIIHQRPYDDWYGGNNLAYQLKNLMTMGAGPGSNPMSQVLFYQTMAWTLLDQYEYLYDDDGDISMIVSQCVEKLRELLPQVTGPQNRTDILETLFNIHQWDINFGGIGISDEVPDILVSETTPEERKLIITWTEKALHQVKPKSDFTSRWRSEHFGELLLDLQLDQLDDEAFIKICRETGRSSDLVERLLTLDRTDEALQVAEQAGDYELLILADSFVHHGVGSQVADIIRKRCAGEVDRRLLFWLRDYAAEAGLTEEALTLSLKVFNENRSVDAYEKILTLAEKLGKEESIRADLLRQMEKQELFDLLTQICLFENRIEDAIKTVWRKPRKEQPFGFISHTPGRYLKARVAEAAEADFPLKAVDLYIHMADTLIDQRGRDNYAEAATYYLRVRSIYKRLNAESTWNELIKEIRTSYKRLYALQDELKQAGL